MAASFDPRTDDRPGSSRAPIGRRLIAPLAGSAMLAMVAMPGLAGATAGPAIVAVTQPAALGADPVDTDDDQLPDALEAELGTDPLDDDVTPNDRDGDLLDNATEERIGTDSDSYDTDQDGLSDFAEVGFEPGSSTGTDPLDADTDDDGSRDGDEVEAGSDPKDADSVPATVPTARPSGSARPSPKPSGQGGVTLPSTGTGPSATDGTGLIAMVAGGALAAVAGAFGLRRRRA